VVGHCHLRNDLRSFRLDRILDVRPTATPFERPADFDALAYMGQAFATLPRRFPFTVLLKTDPDRARRELGDLLGILEPRDDGLLLRSSTDDFDWLARQLARLSFDFVVREPDELRAALRRRADALLSLAKGG
jgi:predicted DNA-binding transcriptional regulator YafY